jgi:ADP-ribose pyrophosphatase
VLAGPPGFSAPSPYSISMNWTTVESELAYTCEGFDVINETVELPDGERAAFDWLREAESVVVLPFTPEKRVVVIDEWRHAVGRVNRGLPAGTLEGDEDPEAAVGRELAEETGYRPGDIEHMTSVEPANGFSDAVFHYFVARGCEEATEQDLDPDETIEVTTTTFEQLREAVREDDLRDGRSAFGVLYYLLYDGQL